MKVAIVSITRTHLLNLAIALENKEDVDVVFYTLSPKFRLRKFGYQGKVVSCFFPVGVLSYAIRFLTRKMSFEKRLRIGHKFRKWFDNTIAFLIRPCDVIVGENGDAYYTSKKAKDKFNPVVICDQGSEHINVQDENYRKTGVYTNPWNTENLLNHYSISDFMMVASEYVKKTDMENGIDERRILYDPYGVNLDAFRITDKPVKDAYDIIMVGNWCVRKGCDMLVKAVLNMNGVKLLHVGVITDAVFPDDVRFHHIDFVPETELVKYYAKSKVFILPSRHEGFGLVLSQAAACGLAVVGSTRTGMPDVDYMLNHPKGCFVIDEPLSIETIRKALISALEFADALPEGERAQFVSRDNLSWSAYGERYYQTLKQITQHHNN